MLNVCLVSLTSFLLGINYFVKLSIRPTSAVTLGRQANKTNHIQIMDSIQHTRVHPSGSTSWEMYSIRTSMLPVCTVSCRDLSLTLWKNSMQLNVCAFRLDSLILPSTLAKSSLGDAINLSTFKACSTFFQLNASSVWLSLGELTLKSCLRLCVFY